MPLIVVVPVDNHFSLRTNFGLTIVTTHSVVRWMLVVFDAALEYTGPFSEMHVTLKTLVSTLSYVRRH